MADLMERCVAAMIDADNYDFDTLARAIIPLVLEDAAKVAECAEGLAKPDYWRGRRDAAAAIRNLKGGDDGQ